MKLTTVRDAILHRVDQGMTAVETVFAYVFAIPWSQWPIFDKKKRD